MDFIFDVMNRPPCLNTDSQSEVGLQILKLLYKETDAIVHSSRSSVTHGSHWKTWLVRTAIQPILVDKCSATPTQETPFAIMLDEHSTRVDLLHHARNGVLEFLNL